MSRVRFRGDPRRFSVAEINRWNATATRDKLGQLRAAGVDIPKLNNYDPSSRIVYAKNGTASDRARFECMAIDPTDCLLWDLDEAGEFDVVFNLAAADPDLAPAVLIEPIAAGEFGRVVIDGPAIAKIEISTDAAFRFATPQTSTHSLLPAAAGPIKLLAAPSESETKWMPVILNVTAIPFRVRVNGRALEFSTDGGDTWTVFGRLNLRLSGGFYQFSIDDHEASPTWTNWLATTSSCPE